MVTHNSWNTNRILIYLWLTKPHLTTTKNVETQALKLQLSWGSQSLPPPGDPGMLPCFASSSGEEDLQIGSNGVILPMYSFSRNGLVAGVKESLLADGWRPLKNLLWWQWEFSNGKHPASPNSRKQIGSSPLPVSPNAEVAWKRGPGCNSYRALRTPFFLGPQVWDRLGNCPEERETEDFKVNTESWKWCGGVFLLRNVLIPPIFLPPHSWLCLGTEV